VDVIPGAPVQIPDSLRRNKAGTEAAPATGKAPAEVSEWQVYADAPSKHPPRHVSPATQNQLKNEVRMRMQAAHREGSHGEVLKLYERLLEAQLPCDTISFNCIVEAKAMRHSVDEAKATMNQLLDLNKELKPTHITYAGMLKAYEANGDRLQAFKLFEEMTAKGINPDQMVYNSLVSTYATAKDYKGAEQLFTEMRNRQVVPSRFTYYRYINACFKHKEAERAFRMLCAMEQEWRTPDVKSYERMMSSFTSLRHTEGQMRCMQGMIALDPETKPSEVIPRLLQGASEQKNVEKVIAVYKMARQADIKLETYDLVGVMMSMVQGDKPIEAFNVVVQLALDGKRIPQHNLGLLIDSLSKRPALVDEAYYEIEKVHEAEGRVPIEAVNTVIEASARMGDLDRAFATWAEFERFGLKSDVGTFNSLLHTCVKTREISSARRLLNRMATDEVTHDSLTYQYRTSLSIMQRNERAAAETLQECIERGLKPTTMTFVTLINWYLRNPKDVVAGGKRAQEIADEMAKHHLVHESLTKRIQDALEGKRAVNTTNNRSQQRGRGGRPSDGRQQQEARQSQ